MSSRRVLMHHRCQLPVLCSALVLGSTLGAANTALADEEPQEDRTFYRCVGHKSTADLARLAAGAVNPEIRMWSTTDSDTDFRLYELPDEHSHTDRTTVVGRVAYPRSIDHDDLKIFYTGYRGIKGNRGDELIKIRGTTTKPLVVGAYGFEGGCMKVNIRYSLSAAQPPIDHRPACLNKNSAHEGWYWQDTGELIELAYCREAAEPVCETWGMPDNDSWQATGWQGLDGWPATEHMHNMAGPIVADECHRTVGIALAGEPCDESVQCFEPYHLECRHGVCTNDLIDQGQGCTGDDDCTGGLVCYGRTFNGMSDVGQCMVDRNQGHGDGHGDDCDTDADCRDGLLCSNLNRAARWGSCYPSWMFYDSREETTFSSPQDIEIHDAPDIGIPGRTDSYHFVTGLASVPVTALASLVVEHDNPQDLRITAYVPGGPTYPWEYETVLWDGQPGNDGSTRIVLEDVELFHTGDDRVEGFWSLRIVDNKPGDRGTLVRWDVKTSSRWD